MANLHNLAPVPEEVGALYDRYTGLVDATVGENLHFGYWDTHDSEVPLAAAANRLTDLMADRLQINSGDRVLDVGCGVGGPGVRIARRTGAQLTGISVSRQQIARANARAASAGLADRVEFRHANAMELPFAEESFDAAIALESIIHMPDREKVLGQIARTLRPGGRLVLTDFFERGPIPEAKRPAVNRYLRDFLMTLADFEDYPAMVRQSGLRLVELLDITEQSCRQTFVQLSAQINESRQSLKSEFDEQIVDQFNPADMIDIPEFGSLLAVAQRP